MTTRPAVPAPPAYEFKPHERAAMPGSPATPEHPTARRVAYFLVAVLVGLTGGFGNALIAANLVNVQGTLGLYSDQAAWLSTAYLMTNVCMNMLLIKFRQQFGLNVFIRIFLGAYVLLTLGHLFVHSFASAIAVRAASGVSAGVLSSLSLFYFIQALPARWRMKAIVLGVGVPQLATPMARLFSSDLLEFAGWRSLYYFELGLAMLSLAAVALFRLPPSERIRVFEKLDLVTFALFAPGMALLCAVLGQGRIVWWTEVPWLGWALCGAIALLSVAMVIEHNRANPLLNTRWLGSGDIVRFALVATLMRLLLSEQSVGVVGLLTALGVVNDQLAGLFGWITLATVAGIAVSVLTIDPQKLGTPIVVALACIAAGSFLDTRATSLYRPQDFVVSQSLLGFAAALFVGPALLFGLTQALKRGPSHLVSFSALFGITQSLGGLAGGALLGTFQVVREKFHSHELVQSITLADPLVAARVQSGAGAYGRVLGDTALRQAEGGASLSQLVTREANVLAFNDVFLVVGALACVAVLWVGFLVVRGRRRAAAAALASTAPAPAVPAASPSR
ncbi:MAG TPA: MFS transporter [Variovorax sp.]|nr:MFS transporter [Variovorax sp.]